MKTSGANQPENFQIVQYPNNAVGEIIKKAKRVEEILNKYGISTVKNSRIGKYRQTLEQFVLNDADPKRAVNLNWLLFHQALFEISQVSRIVEELLKPPTASDWLPRIQMLVSGHIFPQTEQQHTAARDIQFELCVAANCRNGGYEIEPKEPDILVRDFAGDFGVAVKRPKSVKTVEKHIRKGSKQIVASAIDGIIAIDLSAVHNPKNEILIVESREDTGNPVRSAVDDFLEGDDCAIARSSYVQLPNVFGMLVCMTALFFIKSEGKFSTATCQKFVNFCDESSPRLNQLRRFALQFGANAK